MHAYDVAAMSTDYLNRRVDLGKSPTMELHAAKVLCLRSSYQKAESLSRARTTDDNTDSEGVADYAGLLLAHAAYRRTYDDQQRAFMPRLTHEQAFFVSHCLKWCSGTEGTRSSEHERYWHSRSRCIVPLQNMPEFAKAFSCREGDLMNPRDRCRFW
ncbi:neprilysin-3-like [Amblyomma americanum]